MTLAPARPVEAAPAVPGAWRRLAVRCAVAPAAVLLPLATLAPDTGFDVYWHGSTVRNNSWTLITENLRTIPLYLEHGTFAPLGRIVDWSLDVAAYLLVEVLRLPTEIALRLIATLTAIVLTGVVVVFAEAVTARGRMFAAPPGRTLALLPFAVAGCLVAVNPQRLLSTALVLGVAAWLCRGPRRAAAVIAVGAALAAYDEVAILGPVVATVVLAARAWFVCGLDGPATLRRLGPAGLLWLGFLPLYVPIRLVLGDRSFLVYQYVLTVWTPPMQWHNAMTVAARPSMLVLLIAVVAFALLAWRTVGELGRLPNLDRRQAAGLTAAGAVVLLLGATCRSGLTAAGGVTLLVGLLAVRNSIPLHRWAMVGLALTAAGSAVVNQAYAGAVNREEYSLIQTAISREIAQFDASDAGDARRCALRDRFAELTRGSGYGPLESQELPGTYSPVARLDVSLDMATVQMYGQTYCRRSL
ncbi:MAG: hypothetical protein ABW022_09760 [Actinoplanes sp.]